MHEISGAMLVLGSILVFLGRAYGQWRAVPLVPLLWTATGEVLLAALPLAMSVLVDGPLHFMRALWLITGIATCVIGVRVANAAYAAVSRAREYDSLTMLALQEGDTVENTLLDMRRKARVWRMDDPIFAAVWRESGLEDMLTPIPGLKDDAN